MRDMEVVVTIESIESAVVELLCTVICCLLRRAYKVENQIASNDSQYSKLVTKLEQNLREIKAKYSTNYGVKSKDESSYKPKLSMPSRRLAKSMAEKHAVIDSIEKNCPNAPTHAANYF
ncbi:unnamed protein product [Albugo candida]|uniref:Uncharacterized protein n=1 Tax=Albugo candida TaxID=65357 RepID=A0A024FU88_9STRA|nr:unnamed protein product [Albugo candida]|eukprot:CCI10229.1 unnamed protein product [Albugo candida]